jgi:hypothetical protein
LLRLRARIGRSSLSFRYFVEKPLQDESGRDLVYHLPVLLARVPGFIEDLVSFVGGEPLIAEMDGHAGKFTEFGGEGPGFDGLRAFCPVQMEGISHHDSGHAEAAGQARQRAKVFSPVAATMEGENGLRGESQFIGDGNANAAVTDVESEHAGLIGGRQTHGSLSPA